ncbi:MAG: calcium-binding protein, partial [Arcobacteraceae bacterium]
DDVFKASYNDGNNLFYGGSDDEVNGDTVSYELIDDPDYKVVGTIGNGQTIKIYNESDVLEKEDTIYNIENLTGGAGNDTLTGSASKNTLMGGAGDDTLISFGGTGNVLDGGTHNSTIGSGDWASYTLRDSKVTVNLSAVDVNDFSTATIGVNEDYLTHIENIRGTIQADTLAGSSGNNTLNAHQGTNDTLIGGGGDDHLIGSSDGETTFKAGIVSTTAGDFSVSSGNDGSNTYVGYGSDNTLDYSAYDNTRTIEVNLHSSNSVTKKLDGSSTFGTDTISGISNITGGAGNDTIIGSSSQNNTLKGGQGDDTISGGGGQNYLDGGIGNGDYVSYDYLESGKRVIVDLEAGTGSVDVTNFDELHGFENVIGSSGADTLKGSNSDNILIGAEGNDTFMSRGGVNTIYGGTVTVAGDGTLSANALASGEVNTISYEDEAQSVIVDMSQNLSGLNDTGTISTTSRATLYGVQNAIGGTNNDIFKTNTAVANSFDGNSGNDTVDYSNLDATQNISVTLNGSTLATVSITNASNDTIKNIENVTGGAGADSIIGDGTDNILIGGAGNDTLRGTAGNNELYGGADNDMIYSGTGNDLIDGGTGTDTVNYSEAIAAVNVDLGIETAQNVGGGMGEDTLVSIENIIGTNFDDTFKSHFTRDNHFNGYGKGIAGNTVDYSSLIVDNIEEDFVRVDLTTNGQIYIDGNLSATDSYTNIQNIIGTDGNDSIYGDTGANTLRGGAGNDTLMGRDGNDYLDGGSGNNTVSYAYSTSSVELDFKIGLGYVSASDQDTLVGIQNAIGGTNSDIFKMASGDIANTINGNSALGNLVSYEYYTAGVTVDLGSSLAQTVVTGSSDIDTLINIQNIKGGEGNDTFKTNFAISNQFDGNSGNNTMDYSNANASQKIVVTLDGANFRDVSIGTGGSLIVDSIKNIQNVYGGAGNDDITGDGNSNILKGGDGSDILRGIAGLNSLYGEAGADTIYAGTGNDFIDGGADNDTIYANAGENIIYGGSGVDTIFSGSGDDTIYGGTADVIGAEQDWVSFQTALASVTINLNKVSGDSVAGVFAGATGYAQSAATGLDSLFGIENIIGSANADIVILRDDEVNTIYAGAGSDTIQAGTSAYTGGNVIDGFGVTGIETASDSDTVDYSALTDATNHLEIDLNDVDGSGFAAAIFSDGSIASDSLKSIENIIGTAGNDTLIGKNATNNTLIGGSGSDFLMGRSGNNYLDGGDGSSGNTVSYEYVTDDSKKVVIDLELQTANVVGSGYSDTIRNIQNAIGGSGADTITGSAQSNTLEGGSGADTFILTGSADDVVYGGSWDGVIHTDIHNDTIDYSRFNNKLLINLETGNATVDVDNNGFDGTDKEDTFYGIENVVATSQNDTITSGANASLTYNIQAGAGSDTIYVGSGTDSINAGSGDDTIFMRDAKTTNDFIDGSDGLDTVDYSDLSQKIVVNLQDGTTINVTVDSSIDHKITGIENIVGTNQNDTITGNEGKNV